MDDEQDLVDDTISELDKVVEKSLDLLDEMGNI